MRDNPFKRRLEAVADIAFIAGGFRYCSDDSRKDMADFVQWADEFEATRVCPPDGNESYNGKDYMTAIEEFALRKLEAEGLPKRQKAMAEALANFFRVWSDSMLLHDIGPKLSCEECNVLEELLRQHEYNESADNLVDGHVVEDEDGDDPMHIERKRQLYEAEQQRNDTPF